MAFSLDLIELSAEADNLIKTANRDRRILVHRRESLTLRTINATENAAELAKDLSMAQAALATANATIAALPDGIE
jgi:hypothetical protein